MLVEYSYHFNFSGIRYIGAEAISKRLVCRLKRRKGPLPWNPDRPVKLKVFIRLPPSIGIARRISKTIV